MATTLDLIDLVWEETFAPTVREMTKAGSKYFSRMDWNSSGVDGDPATSRDWEYIQPFVIGAAGAAEFAPVSGPDTATIGANLNYTALKDIETYPGMAEMVNPGYFQVKHRLKMMNTNIIVPTQIFRAARLGGVVDDLTERYLKANAKRIANLCCKAFFASSTGTIVRTVAATSGTISSTGLTITLADGWPISRVSMSGDSCDIFVTGSNTRLNIQPIIITRPDAFGTSASPVSTSGGTVTLSHTGSFTTVLASNQYDLVIRNSGRENSGDLSRLPSRLESILVDEGEISDYGVWVSGSPAAGEYGLFPELKSLVRDLGGETPSETLFAPYISHFCESNQGLFHIDTLWGRPGGWAAYYHNLEGGFRHERNGTTVKITGGVQAGVSLNYYGYELEGDVDHWILPGTWIGTAMNTDEGPNWQVKLPPRIPGSTSHPAFDPHVEFAASLFSGGNSIWTPYYAVGGPNAGALSKNLQAPAELMYEISPRQIPGVRLFNGAEHLK